MCGYLSTIYDSQFNLCLHHVWSFESDLNDVYTGKNLKFGKVLKKK